MTRPLPGPTAHDRDGEHLDLGYADGLRHAANRIRKVLRDAEVARP